MGNQKKKNQRLQQAEYNYVQKIVAKSILDLTTTLHIFQVQKYLSAAHTRSQQSISGDLQPQHTRLKHIDIAFFTVHSLALRNVSSLLYTFFHSGAPPQLLFRSLSQLCLKLITVDVAGAASLS